MTTSEKTTPKKHRNPESIFVLDFYENHFPNGFFGDWFIVSLLLIIELILVTGMVIVGGCILIYFLAWSIFIHPIFFVIGLVIGIVVMLCIVEKHKGNFME